MGYAAIALALLGFVAGLLFRLRILLSILALILLLSIIFSVSSGFSFLGTTFTILVAQTIAQGSYFLGLVARTFFVTGRVRPIL